MATKEWQVIREMVFERDDSTCQICKKRNPYIKFQGEFNYQKVREATQDEINLFEEKKKQWLSEKVAKYGKDSRLYKICSKQRSGISHPFVEDWLELHVHHKYYIKNTLAWDYDVEAFVTLCVSCHLNFHAEHSVLIFKEKPNFNLPLENQIDKTLNICSRCGGAKIIHQYKHIEGGICFKCRGTGYELNTIIEVI